MNSPLTALIALGLFCTLSAFSQGKYHPPGEKADGNGATRKAYTAAKPVHLWRASDLRREQCGDDWLCLVAWAEERRKGGRL